MTDYKNRKEAIRRLYNRMEYLSDEYDADDARIEKVDRGRCAIVLEFEIPSE